MSRDLGVPLLTLDIEIPEQLEAADRLVEEHGDWSEDYLIPQVFIEHVDGRVNHVLTGFSEAVSVTEGSWKALFSSSYYQSLVHEQPTISYPHSSSHHKSLKEFVKAYLTFEGQCYRHCDSLSSFVDLRSDSDNVIGAYVCPGGYVSRVVYFSVHPDVKQLRTFLISQVGNEIVNDRDIRPATRHWWELGGNAMAEIGEVSPIGVIKEIYWTVYAKTEDERRLGVFVCSHPRKGMGCNRLFVKTRSQETDCAQSVNSELRKYHVG
jgi:hypothetical protein